MLDLPLASLVFILCLSLIAGFSACTTRLGSIQALDLVKKQNKAVAFLIKNSPEGKFRTSLDLSKYIFFILYLCSAFPFAFKFTGEKLSEHTFLLVGIIILALPFCSVGLFKFVALLNPKGYLIYLGQLTALLVIPTLPIVICLHKIFQKVVPNPPSLNPFFVKNKILEILHDSEISSFINEEMKNWSYLYFIQRTYCT